MSLHASSGDKHELHPCHQVTISFANQHLPRFPFLVLSCLILCLATRQLFVGLESGVVEEFSLARDYNRLDSTRVYHAHDKVGVNSWS